MYCQATYRTCECKISTFPQLPQQMFAKTDNKEGFFAKKYCLSFGRMKEIT